MHMIAWKVLIYLFRKYTYIQFIKIHKIQQNLKPKGKSSKFHNHNLSGGVIYVNIQGQK